MGRKYKQLSLEERCEIARLQAEGRSIGQIAAALDRAPSTISREVRRNRGRQVGYNNTPRKCLDFETPAEMFHKLLHFECESTSPLSRGRQARSWLSLIHI